MRLSGLFIALLVACLLGGCATEPLRFRDEALVTLERVQGEGGGALRPGEYRSALDALAKADALLNEGERGEAERYFQLTLLKGSLLEREIREQKARLREAERLAQEQKRAELVRQAQEEANRLVQHTLEEEEKKEAAEAARRKAKPVKERPLVSSYTVRRGQSLPLIASQPEVYGDRNLWPLIYRANRDQISDPRHIWPGQVLRIPRNTGRDDIGEARRYALDRPLH